MIPKLIHQTWRSETLPVVFQKMRDANIDCNKDFEFKLWYHTPGPPTIDEFIEKEYPDIYQIFQKAKYGVQKSDIARLAILHHYGGIYFDLDMLCLKSIDTLIDYNDNSVYIAMEPSEQTKRVFGKDNVLCNAFIAAPAKHELFKQALEEVKMLHARHGDAIYNIFNAFGADLLAKAMSSDALFKTCRFINRNLVYPISDPKFSELPSSQADAAMLKEGKYGNSYMVHYWIHSDFESKGLLEKFSYIDDKTIHENMLTFFRELYPANKHLV